MQRTAAVSALSDWSTDASGSAASSGLVDQDGTPRLIVPQHDNDSYQWLSQTRQMLTRGEWRVRHIDYDNAPYGRATHLASAYRWWLGFLAWCDHAVSGRPLPLALERAALLADPLLHGMLLVTVVLFAARRLGFFPAILLSAGIATIFPLAGGFLSGAPDHHGLAWACALASTLLLATGLRTQRVQQLPAANIGRVVRSDFFLAGVAGGFGLWISAATLGPILAGVVPGALAAAWMARSRGRANPSDSQIPPWRCWGAGGAAMSFAAYLIEYFPSHLGWHLEVNHPLHAVAWLGGAELLARGTTWIQGRHAPWQRRELIVVGLATVAVLALPVAMDRQHTLAFLSPEPFSTRLTYLNDVAAPNVVAWILRDGFTLVVAATLLPLLLIGPAVALLLRRRTDPGRRQSIAFTLGPLLVALGLAYFQLNWWNGLDSTLLALLAILTTTDASVPAARSHWLWSGLIALMLIPGTIALIPPRGGDVQESLTVSEVEGLVERDLAHWLAHRSGPEGAVIFAPPDLTASLAFHGGLRGLGTLSWENRDGLTAAIRIASASSQEEAFALVQRRGISYIVIPSWDSFLDEFARMGSGQSEGAFINALHRWALPAWLRPIPYNIPAITGFENQSVAVFEVVDEQEPAAAFSRLAEYFVETGQLDLAVATRSGLQQFPGDLGAMAALAQVDWAMRERGDFAGAFQALLSGVSTPAERALPWDRRVSLAIVLAQGKRADLAREQVQKCLGSIDEDRIRSLTTESLFRLQLLGRRYDVKISDPRLQRLAHDLLSPEMNQRLAK